MEQAIKISRIQKQIDEFQLGPIDLRIESGMITALAGNNGAGKSTLLKLILNLVKQNQGNIELFGQVIRKEEEDWQKRVAYLPQSMPGAVPFTGKELRNLVSHWYPNWDEQLFQRMIDLFEVPLKKQYEKLSQGAKQKLNLALALPRNAELLILDEPTSHLDIPAKKVLQDLLVEWMEHGDKTILFASHQVEEIRKLADYIAIMKNGKLIGSFEKDELTEQYKRYWFPSPILENIIPGEVERKGGTIVTSNPIETEKFFRNKDMRWIDSKAVELDEILTFMLSKKG
ncbi:ABC transporter ATP-binding protein [Lederbergia lenta]|uniref:ABC transporter ATP-binding protein n=1 Tax=Lederbergia lenta TaxID=1467 RepID=A0A2X4W1W2_LEDLE|nr:ABC transporter ATP-binding protein [Lederbergia lenta]MEC2323702.1 ABC transporter ATP-binding protein [Lederbergia lenta]SQI51600.1 ABC transporter ATP-binding protein [Lederbergia lenta]